MKRKLNYLHLCLILLYTKHAVSENVLAIRQSELFPVSIIHMNDFHARLIYLKHHDTITTNTDRCSIINEFNLHASDSKKRMKDQPIANRKMARNVLVDMLGL